jgi:hypothetical protein
MQAKPSAQTPACALALSLVLFIAAASGVPARAASTGGDARWSIDALREPPPILDQRRFRLGTFSPVELVGPKAASPLHGAGDALLTASDRAFLIERGGLEQAQAELLCELEAMHARPVRLARLEAREQLSDVSRTLFHRWEYLPASRALVRGNADALRAFAHAQQSFREDLLLAFDDAETPGFAAALQELDRVRVLRDSTMFPAERIDPIALFRELELDATAQAEADRVLADYRERITPLVDRRLSLEARALDAGLLATTRYEDWLGVVSPDVDSEKSAMDAAERGRAELERIAWRLVDLSRLIDALHRDTIETLESTLPSDDRDRLRNTVRERLAHDRSAIDRIPSIVFEGLPTDADLAFDALGVPAPPSRFEERDAWAKNRHPTPRAAPLPSIAGDEQLLREITELRRSFTAERDSVLARLAEQLDQPDIRPLISVRVRTAFGTIPLYEQMPPGRTHWDYREAGFYRDGWKRTDESLEAAKSLATASQRTIDSLRQLLPLDAREVIAEY